MPSIEETPTHMAIVSAAELIGVLPNDMESAIRQYQYTLAVEQARIGCHIGTKYLLTADVAIRGMHTAEDTKLVDSVAVACDEIEGAIEHINRRVNKLWPNHDAFALNVRCVKL